MEGVALLLARSWIARLKVELDGNDLKISGPSNATALVQEIAGRKAEVVAHLVAMGCGPLHIRPERWAQHGGKAYCPMCGKFMGNLRGGG